MDVRNYLALYRSEADDALQSLESGLIGLESAAEPLPVVNELFRHAHNLKGISGAMGYDEIVEASHALESALDEFRRGGMVTVAKIGCMLGVVDILRRLVQCALDAARDAETAGAGDALCAHGGESDGASAKSVQLLGEALVLLSRMTDEAPRPGSVTRPVSPPEAGNGRDTSSHEPLERRITSTKVELERLDRIMDLVGELVTSRIRMSGIASELGSRALHEELALSWRLVSQVQKEIMEARLIPVGQVFQRFSRLVRDVSHETGKRARLEISGGEIGLDRIVLEGMVDALVHIIRNALDHGIELPDERVAAGKSAEAVVSLAARREHGAVVLEVSDDGRGIDLDRVAAAAAEAGIAKARGSDLREEELCRILATPGFSTAREAGRLSGRGMGMNIVKKAVDSFGGSIRLASAAGRGTTITLVLPINLSIIKALLFSIGDEGHALPIEYVSETSRFELDSLKTVNGARVLPYDDRVVPVLMPEDVIGVPADISGERYARVIVVDTGRRRVAVVVNRIIGQQDIMIKALPPLFRGVRGISGATILGSGKVAFVWDPHVLFEERCTYESDQAALVPQN